MPKSRKTLISLDSTPYYHCVSRCVRRAFLCGTDTFSGQCYEHRRQWVEDKLLVLSQVFALDVCAYAVLSNHYHVVLHIDQERAEGWTALEVVERWHQLFSGTILTQRYQRGEALDGAECQAVDDTVRVWRERLCDISWYMRVINEGVARQANTEDQCTGRFWEGRFKSQALLDEQALVACMAYVDLNPIRANMAETPEQSEHTSARNRITKAKQAISPNQPTQQASDLMPFVGYPKESLLKGIPFKLTDYIELLDWTGRMIRDDKRGAIPTSYPPILARLNLSPKHWLYTSQHFEHCFKGLVGKMFKLKETCEQLGYQRTPGKNHCYLLT